MNNDIDTLVLTLKALANKPRLQIIDTLSAGEKNVGELVNITGLSQSAVSQHLNRLRRSGLVSARRDAQSVYYSLNKNKTAPVLSYIVQNRQQKAQHYETEW